MNLQQERDSIERANDQESPPQKLGHSMCDIDSPFCSQCGWNDGHYEDGSKCEVCNKEEQ